MTDYIPYAGKFREINFPEMYIRCAHIAYNEN